MFASTESFAGPIGAALEWETAVAAACALGLLVGSALGRNVRRGRTRARDDADPRQQSGARVEGALLRISSLLAPVLTRGETLEAMARAAEEALAGDVAIVLIPAGERLEQVGGEKLPVPLADLITQSLGGAPGPPGGQRSVIAVPSLARDARLPAALRAGAAAHGYAALLSVSVDEARDAGSTQVVVFFREERTFTDDELEIVRYLADASRDALLRAAVFEAERSRRAVAERLTRTGRLLASELDPAAVLGEVVEQAPRLIGADACAIRLLEGDELVVAAADGPGADAAEGTRSSVFGWLCGDVVQSGRPVALPSAGDDPRLRETDALLARGHVAYLGVPLEGPEGTGLGTLAVYASVARIWETHEIEALQALAAGTSAALANAGLYQAIALEKERGAAILANIADGIVAVDREGDVVLWNAAAERITGVAARDALGCEPPVMLRRTFESPDEAPSGDRLVPIMRGRDEVWLSISEAVMRDPAGTVAGRVFAFRDISADRLVEQVKSDFVSAVSHELRTPLTSIYGFAETLLRRDVAFSDEERATFLGYIASESQRLTAIVDSLLSVARLDTGDLEVQLSVTDIRAVADRAVETVRGAETNGHHFVFDLPEGPLPATADPEKLHQVLLILLDNALRYSPAGGTVTLGAVRKRDLVEINVTDEGVGIPHSEHEQVFRKFYRGTEAGLRAGTGGTGLGLFIARGLVTAMGGRIWVVPRERSGTRLALELPAARRDE